MAHSTWLSRIITKQEKRNEKTNEGFKIHAFYFD